MPDWKAMGDAAKARREELGLTQQQVADRTGTDESDGLDAQTVRMVEKGEQKSYHGTTLSLVSQALEKPANWLKTVAYTRDDTDDRETIDDETESRFRSLEADMSEVKKSLRAVERALKARLSKP